jgi:hypothetical protein
LVPEYLNNVPLIRDTKVALKIFLGEYAKLCFSIQITDSACRNRMGDFRYSLGFLEANFAVRL